MSDTMNEVRQSYVFETEIGQIKDEEIRAFVLEALDAVPKEFYLAPASTSGKYHPTLSLGEGGLVRHVKAMCYFAEEFFQAYCIEDQLEKDTVIAACLLHDIGKVIAEPHDVVGACWLSWRLRGKDAITGDKLTGVIRAARWHMGPWATGAVKGYDKDLQMPRRFPQDFTVLEQIVHVADYACSRKRLELNERG